ncbi:MAG TPA: FAD-dependent oxidoreductase [Vicinamibacterales bacterium]|nr:FAD-dependent oxidoreductase [Vicinamibacterales bacterium]
MQPRDATRLESVHFDVLVVGGGIHGLTTAYEAASRGLRTALIEAADFGSGISFNHQKTAHGGLRSLQSLRLDRAREAIREQRALARIAPWLVRPIPFVMGTYRSAVKGRLALRAGFRLDRWLGRKRNAGVERELHLPFPKLLSRGLTLKLFPGLDQRNLTGGAQWYDYQMVQNDRLTLAFAVAADRAGAVLVNYVEAAAAIREDGRIAGMTARDRESWQSLTIRASMTINAAGARAGEVMAMFGVQRPLPLLAAMNLVTSKPAREIALAAPSSSGRMLTLVPWQGRAIVGTSHSNQLVTPADTQASAAEVAAFIREANEAFPALRLARQDVTLVHRGLVPAAAGQGEEPHLLPAAAIHDHSRDGAAGAMTIVGVKYTTARAVAERTITKASRALGRRLRPSSTGSTVLPGAGLADHEALAIETARHARIDLRPDVIERLSTVYAERSADIIRLMAERPELRQPLAPESAATAAEIVYVIHQEMAIHLSDAVVRRLGLGAAGHPGPDVLSGCARVMAAELDWSDGRTAEEIAAVEEIYRVP